MLTLGINAAFHDCAAALVDDGRVVAASEEERFTHVKHGKRPVPFTTWQLPFHAIDHCLATAGALMSDVDRIAYSFDPAAVRPVDGVDAGTLPHSPRSDGLHPDAWQPLFMASIRHAPGQLVDGAPHHLGKRFRGLDHATVQSRWRFVEHHLAHEASAFLAAPYDACAVLTMDGRGEEATTTFGQFDGRDFDRLRQIGLPHSLGLLYEDVTRYLGFLHSSDEYKVMALASYGQPRYLAQFADILVLGHDDYALAPSRLEERFGPARRRGEPFVPHHFDLARSLQEALEVAVLQLASSLHRETGADRLAMAGGVALNCVANARVRDEGPFADVWVQPAAGDAGTALGAALWTDWRERGRPPRHWSMDHAYLGPSFADDEIESFLEWTGVAYRRVDDVAEETAALLAAGKVIGWFQGRMEFGPRALGARSILASPVEAGMQARLNEIKDREDFRPVAPMVLEERAHEWFRTGSEASRHRDGESDDEPAGDGPEAHDAGSDGNGNGNGNGKPFRSPFMLFVFDVLPEQAARIPAVRHVDGTARVQTVSVDQNPLAHRLLSAFERRTGVPVLINTSFNTRGEPIVCTPRDAVESFWTSPLDALSIGSYIVEKART